MRYAQNTPFVAQREPFSAIFDSAVIIMYKTYPSTIERKNQLRWQKIVRLDGLGLPVEQIAKLSGYTYDQVCRTLENPYYQEWRKAKLEGACVGI